jgi:chemotaxis protein methyltransferase WspC
VREDGIELQALIDAVVVPESWFFRDAEAFAMLAGIGVEKSRRLQAGGVLRLLSLPSSTGEEPYSMAMALLDAGVSVENFRIDAVDVSARAIAQGDRAVYGRNSFRGHDLTFRERHFDNTPLGYRPSEAVRQQVTFRHGNIMAADFIPGVEIYDIIFCRNLLIYFDRATQDRVVGVLRRLLHPNGTLFVAPSETNLLLAHDFVSAKVPLAFAFSKSVIHPVDPKPKTVRLRQDAAHGSTARPRPDPPHASRPAKPAVVPKTDPADPAQPPSPLGPPSGLDDAARLADRGRFVEAAACCEEHLRRQGPSVEAFHLLGLVRDAAGNPTDAADCYRKALYLDPEHHETLVHLALLVEQQGNSAGAQVLRNRARRLERSRS